MAPESSTTAFAVGLPSPWVEEVSIEMSIGENSEMMVDALVNGVKDLVIEESKKNAGGKTSTTLSL